MPLTSSISASDGLPNHLAMTERSGESKHGGERPHDPPDAAASHGFQLALFGCNCDSRNPNVNLRRPSIRSSSSVTRLLSMMVMTSPAMIR